MKKVLLLLISIYVCVPSFVYAQEKQLDFFKDKESKPEVGTHQYKTTGGVNGSWDWQSFLMENSYCTGGQNGYLSEMRRIYRDDKQGIYVRFQTPENNSAGVSYRGSFDNGYFNIPSEFPVRISIARGKITKVEVQSKDGFEKEKFIPTDGTTFEFNGTDTYTLTSTNPDGIVTFNYGDQVWVNRITVFYTDEGSELPAPEPFLQVREELGYKYDEKAKTLAIPHFYSETTAASYFTASEFEDICYTFSDIKFEETMSYDRYPLSTSFTESVNPANKVIIIPQRIGVRYKYAFEPNDATIGKDKPKVLRYISRNIITDQWSEEKSVTVSTYRFPAPTIDLAKIQKKNTTAKDFQWDSDNKILYYSGYSPIVYLTNTTPVVAEQYEIRYEKGFEDITPLIYGGSHYNDEEGILISNGNEGSLPPDGAKEGINVWSWRQQGELQMNNLDLSDDSYYIYYTPEKGKYETIILQCYNNGSGGTTTIQINAPQISVEAKTVTLSGNVWGYPDETITVDISSTHDWGDGQKGKLQYLWTDSWDEFEPTGTWNDVSDGKYTVSGTGRLFVREYKPGCVSNTAYQDFRYLENSGINDLSASTLAAIPEGGVVRVNTTMWVRGGYTTTNAATPGYESGMVFITDKQGNALRIVSEYPKGGANKSFIAGENSAIPAGGLIGVLRGQKNGLPELYLTTSTIDYTPFLEETKNNLGVAPEIKEVNELKQADFSKLLLFTAFTWNEDEGCFIDSNGNKAKAFPRLKSNPDWDDIKESLDDGVTYRIKGFVGFNNGEAVILPLAVVPGLRLLAPNPINPQAAPGEYIKMNVISPELNITINPEGVDDEALLEYFFCEETTSVPDNYKRWKSAKQIENAINGTITITTGTDANPGELADGGCTLAVRLVSDGLASGVVTVRFNKITIDDNHMIMSLDDFKNRFVDGTDIVDPSIKENEDKIEYFQYHGHAQVRDIFGKYLYIRDIPQENGFTKDELSSHSILLYNDYGWNAVVAMEENVPSTGDGERVVDSEPRPLKVGDVLTNFALIPYRTGYGNLVGYATGFARTLRRTMDEPVVYEPDTINAQETDARGFAETDRMLLYLVRRVKVLRTGDVGNYTYSLDMPGKPVLNVGGIYPAIRNWDVIWSPDVIYNLEGVVMLASDAIPEGEDGRYMLALKDFSLSDVATPRAPRIELVEGAGVDVENGTFINSAKVKLVSNTASNNDNADIWYTLDGTDPRTSETAMLYDKDKMITITRNRVIKAYVLANGMPNSEVADTLFTRTGVDCRYLVNFIDEAVEGVPYRITADVRVVAKGGKYLFVRGTQGHYLPISFEDEAALNKLKNIKVGQYLNDFVATAHRINTPEFGSTMRGAHVEGELVKLFGSVQDNKPDNIESISIEPDTVRTITAANARRYVKMLGVKLEGVDFNSDDVVNRDLSWTLKTNKGEGNYEVIRVNIDNLKYEYDWSSTDQSAAAYYNVYGFAMIGMDGGIELWPTEVEKVKTPKLVVASFDDNVSYNSGLVDGKYEVIFYPHTTVSLSGVKGATIYYQICDSEDDTTDESTWNKYGQPFTVAKSCYIHIYSVAPGYEQSSHTHIEMILGDESTKISGELVFSHVLNKDGDPVITIEPADKNLAPGTYDIYYTTDGTIPTVLSNRYTGEFVLPGGGFVFAILKEANKEPGKVANYNVWYAPSGIGVIESNGENAVRIEGGNIIAPEGSEVFDLNGRRVASKGLRSGIYIVHIPGGKSLKVSVR